MTRRIRPEERGAHLRDPDGYSPPVARYAPSPSMADAVRWFWVPVWDLPDGQRTVQRVLAYPVCNLVVESSSAVLVGPQSGLATRELTGSGWAVAAMAQPASGSTLVGGPVTGLTDRGLPLEELSTLDGRGLAADVRAAMGAAPGDRERQEAAVGVLEEALAWLAPMDEEGLLVNAIVEYVEGDQTVRRVGQVCDKFDLSERSLQRLTARRIGLSPKWLIQRRRLQEAVARLSTPGPADLSGVAADLGYADQAHFTRDFRRVTGLTPGEYAAEPHP